MSVRVSSSMEENFLVLTVHGVTQEALPLLGEQMEKHGASLQLVTLGDRVAGSGDCASGRFIFRYENERLTIKLLENHNHFPAAMLIGGLRQMAEEAMELVNKRAATA